MRCVNNSIWKFINGHWAPQKLSGDTPWSSPILTNNKAFVSNSINRPGSHHTTFNHIKTDSAVYLFNGYGLNNNNLMHYTGALWQYTLEAPAPPNLQVNISQDDFVPNGASPYSFSTREVTVVNSGLDSAKNVIVNIGLSTLNNYSAMRLNNVRVVNSSNALISNAKITGSGFVSADIANAPSCAFDSTTFKSSIQVQLPVIRAGQTIKISAKVEHCMANFDQPTFYHYSWNYWGVKATYSNNAGKSFISSQANKNISNTLDSYKWADYITPIPTLSVITGSKLFTLELGSGVLGSPTNNQDLGVNFPNAQVRIDLTLPQNVFLSNGALTDIVGEYAVVNGTSVQLFNVNASSIDFGYTKAPNVQSYIIRFPSSRYLPIRRVYLKLRANSGTIDTSNIKAQIRTTFNSTYANLDFGWKPASQ